MVDTLSLIRSHLVSLPMYEKENIMSELQAHLEDKAASLRAQGHPAPEAAANAAFGDPQTVAAQLADVHSRPTRRQTILAVLPFIMTGMVLPLLIMAIVALDRALGPMPEKFLRIMGLRLYHVESTIILAFVVLGMCALFALGAFIGLLRRLPLWSVVWVGSTLNGLIDFVQLLLDEEPERIAVLANLALIVVILGGLIAIARWRGGAVALLIVVACMLQIGITNAYALSTPPLNLSVLAVLLAVIVSIVAILAVLSALHKQPGYRLHVTIAVLLSIVPYGLQLALQVDAATAMMRLLVNVALPTILLLLVPYLLGRRDLAMR